MKFFHYTDREQFKFVSELIREHYDLKLSMLSSDVLCISGKGFADRLVRIDDYIVFDAPDPLIVPEKRWHTYACSFLEPEEIHDVTRILTQGFAESDPLGKSQHEKGSKLDNGKSEPSLILGSMSQALQAVIEVADYGKKKYTENSWLDVPEAEKRYTDAMLRHYLAEQTEDFDKDSGLLHSAHLAWNALARLHFILKRTEGEVLYPPYQWVSGLNIVQHEVGAQLSPVHLRKHTDVSPLVPGTEEHEKALALWNQIVEERKLIQHATNEFLYLKFYSSAYLSEKLIEVRKRPAPLFYNQKSVLWEGREYYSLASDPSKLTTYYAEFDTSFIIAFN